MELLIIAGIDISHARLVDLTRLADQSKPFYEWVEAKFQNTLSKDAVLEDIIHSATVGEIKRGLTACYYPSSKLDVPLLFDGVGRTYPHPKACYYFFSWLIRDAPQQRLAPLIQRIAKNTAQPRSEVEIDVLAALITQYRDYVKTFSWEVLREVIIDRLEGSRRSIKGHEKEAVVRTALLVAIQNFYEQYKTYGVFSGVEIPERQVTIDSESYDVSANLLDADGNTVRRILIPIKTRETEGGGHSHLFTRDITSAINAAKKSITTDYLAVVIVAKNWSKREAEHLTEIVDHLSMFDLSPGEFSVFDDDAQNSLNDFIVNVFNGAISPKQGSGNE